MKLKESIIKIRSAVLHTVQSPAGTRNSLHILIIFFVLTGSRFWATFLHCTLFQSSPVAFFRFRLFLELPTILGFGKDSTTFDVQIDKLFCFLSLFTCLHRCGPRRLPWTRRSPRMARTGLSSFRTAVLAGKSCRLRTKPHDRTVRDSCRACLPSRCSPFRADLDVLSERSRKKVKVRGSRRTWWGYENAGERRPLLIRHPPRPRLANPTSHEKWTPIRQVEWQSLERARRSLSWAFKNLDTMRPQRRRSAVRDRSRIEDARQFARIRVFSNALNPWSSPTGCDHAGDRGQVPGASTWTVSW